MKKVVKEKAKRLTIMDMGTVHPNPPHVSQKSKEEQFAEIEEQERKVFSGIRRRDAKKAHYEKKLEKRRRHAKIVKMMKKKFNK